MISEIVEKSAHELRSLIGSRKLSPVEVFDSFRAQIERVNPAVNAFVATDFERARQEAKEAENAVMQGKSLGLLHGLPVGIKDLQLTKGLRTTFGALPYKDNVPDTDELMVTRIRKAGGVVMGKTNTPEFGAGANTVNRVYGATVNPFDLKLSASGSSGGSAAALAANMVPLATGSDLGGSLRTPASFCGVVGHRPSPGACPTDRASDAWSPMAVGGPMARTVADAALLMAAVLGKAGIDPISQPLAPEPFAALPHRDTGSMRVAFSADLGVVPVDENVRQHFNDVAGRLAPLFAGGDWCHPQIRDVDETFEALRAVGFGHSYGDYARAHRDVAGINVVSNVELSQRLTVADVGRAHLRQSELYRSFQHFFSDIDLLICPAASVVPFPVEQVYVQEVAGVAMETYIRWVAITYAVTLSSHPVITIPAGYGPTGLPFGIQIVGKARDDIGTLAAAAAIETALATDPALRRPIPDFAELSRQDVSTAAGTIPEALCAR